MGNQRVDMKENPGRGESQRQRHRERQRQTEATPGDPLDLDGGVQRGQWALVRKVPRTYRHPVCPVNWAHVVRAGVGGAPGGSRA